MSAETSAVVWAVVIGLYVFLFMLGVSISLGTSIVISICSAAVTFFAVLLYGRSAPSRDRRTGG